MTKPTATKPRTPVSSYRLDSDTLGMLERVAAKLSLSRTAVLKLAVRAFAAASLLLLLACGNAVDCDAASANMDRIVGKPITWANNAAECRDNMSTHPKMGRVLWSCVQHAETMEDLEDCAHAADAAVKARAL